MEEYKNVTYEFYTKTLKRDIITTPSDFDRLAIQEKLRMQNLIDMGLVQEKYTDGIDSTVCLWIEEAYKAEAIERGDEEASFNTSESIGSYSHQTNTAALDVYMQKNSKSVEQKRIEWLKLYCNYYNAF